MVGNLLGLLECLGGLLKVTAAGSRERDPRAGGEGQLCGEGQHAHGEDGGDLIEGRNEDADLADAGRQEQGPCWLSVGFAVAKDLRTE